MKRNTRQLYLMIFVFAIIIAAYSCRLLAWFNMGGNYPSYVRAALYLLLFVLWGYSLDQRIIQKPVLHCLRLMDVLMLIWLTLRTLKYEVVTDMTVARYLWYLYYLPIIFIPLLGVYIAIFLGKSENYQLSKKSWLLSLIPAALFLAVITNDLHQQVFVFESGIPGVPDNKVFFHRPVYFVILVWVVGCVCFSIVQLLKKTRLPSIGKRRMMPFVISCVMLLYGVLYLLGFQVVRDVFGDMNVMFCLFYAAIYESCIHCRMIQSNTGYVELYEATTLASCIADQNGHILLRSRTAGENMVCPQEGESIVCPDGMRISAAPVKDGFVIWGDNVQHLTELRARLDENKRKKENNKKKLKDAYLVQKQLYELTEKNHIYDELEEKHKKQTERIKELLEQCRNAKPPKMREHMKEILLLGTYIKRSANLYFLSQEYEKLPQQELRLTIDELVRAMNSCEVECGVVYLTTKPIASKEVERLFELLKTIMEMTISELHSLFISVSDQEMNLSVECMTDLSEIASAEVMVCREDGLWLIRTLIGGEANA
ncbi:histidine kinase N-terminal 7TM domain-containing protein [Dorea sp. BIOML-A1]|uniref:histidine kinase N-terminal 7TM domain-containing protein n=1 Tax=Dorea sp. BIOML-A1 TaxID=2584637 RepID=UPI002ED53474